MWGKFFIINILLHQVKPVSKWDVCYTAESDVGVCRTRLFLAALLASDIPPHLCQTCRPASVERGDDWRDACHWRPHSTINGLCPHQVSTCSSSQKKFIVLCSLLEKHPVLLPLAEVTLLALLFINVNDWVLLAFLGQEDKLGRFCQYHGTNIFTLLFLS